MTRRSVALLLALSFALLLLARLVGVWAGRLLYPFDLEWMEGGILAHAWRLEQGLPVYVAPNPDFVPFVYPPGYPAVLAALGTVFGLSLPLGRAVSLVSIAVAALLVGHGVRKAGGGLVVAACAAVAFLGTYPQSGSFYDLVRGDALGVALLAGAVALGLEPSRRAAVGAGLLLAAAFLVKQNVALFGLPMALGIGLRDRRAALLFVAASVGPALASLGALQAWSGGQMLVWVLDVPRSHPMVWGRAALEVPREWGAALPVGFAVVASGWLGRALAGQRTVPAWFVASSSIGLGALWLAYGGWENAPLWHPLGWTLTYVAMIAGPVALLLYAVGASADRALGQGEPLPSWDWFYEVGVVLVAAGGALVMRVHESGFVNVHTPLFWALAWALGRSLGRWDQRSAGLDVAAPLLLAAQLAWSLPWVRADLVPTAADEAMGWRFVEAIRATDGPVLSPFSAWTPTYAGRPPSLHAMGVWDCQFPGNPYQEDLAKIDDALRDHHWALILGGPHPMQGEFLRHYQVKEELMAPFEPVFVPRTGFLTRPHRLLVPKAVAP